MASMRKSFEEIMKTMMAAIPFLLLSLTSCQHPTAPSAGVVQSLQDNKGKKVTVYVGGGSPDSRFVGKVVEVNLGSNLLILEFDYRMSSSPSEPPSTRTGRYFIDLSQICAVRVHEE